MKLKWGFGTALLIRRTIVRTTRSTIAILICALSAFCGTLHSQAPPTESKVADFQIGGGFSGIRPDYTHTNFYGPTIYSTFDFHHHIGVEVDIHLGDYNAPSNLSEKTYEVGVRYNLSPRFAGQKFNFYPKFLYGRGVFDNVFNAPSSSQQDNIAYNIYTIGGGIEYRFSRHINLRLGDFESQHWLTFPYAGTNTPLNHGLTPYVVTVGAAYHF